MNDHKLNAKANQQISNSIDKDETKFVEFELIEDTEENQTLWESIKDVYYKIKWFFHDRYFDCKYFIQRNITQGYSDIEVYGLHWHATQYILPRLKAMRSNLHSFPGEITIEEYQEMKKILENDSAK